MHYFFLPFLFFFLFLFNFNKEKKKIIIIITQKRHRLEKAAKISSSRLSRAVPLEMSQK
jgi:hypothetical protein